MTLLNYYTYRSVCRDKKKFIVALVKEAEDIAKAMVSITTTYNAERGHKTLNGLFKDFNGRLSVHDGRYPKG